MTKRKSFSRQFKIDAVRLVIEQGYRVTEAARSLGIHPNMLSSWKRQLEAENEDAFPGKGQMTPEKEELHRLRKRVKQLEMERETCGINAEPEHRHLNVVRSPEFTEEKSNNKEKPKTAGMLTYEELSQQVDALRKRMAELEKNELKYRTLFNHTNDEIIFTDLNGKIKELNEKCEDIFGLKREEVIGRNLFDFKYLNRDEMKDMAKRFQKVLSDKDLKIMDYQIRRKDGTVGYIEVSPSFLEQEGEIKGVITVVRDVTARKQTEAELTKYRAHLEDLVKERTANLEEANIALKVMLKKEDEIKNEFEDKILFNVAKLILPNLENIKAGNLTDKQKIYLNIIESNLYEIISPFSRKMTSKFFNLTPTELHIANLIKHGRSTKVISDLTNVSINTVKFHRANIRKKIGLHNKKTNLTSYLQSLQD